MKLKIIIPEGYRKLRVGELIKKGDRFADFHSNDWKLSECRDPYMRPFHLPHIRKIK